MFKYTLAATLDEMDREGITVAECPLRSMRCLSLQNGRIVGINTARFDSSAEVRTALIHEDGHFASGAFYLPYSPYQLKAQAEYRADKAAVLKHIPYPELAARLRRHPCRRRRILLRDRRFPAQSLCSLPRDGV